MNPLSIYTGLAYDFAVYNCWHHVRNVRADHGLHTPMFDCASPELAGNVFEAGHDDAKGMEQIDDPEPFCAVLMKSRGKWHSGVYLDGMVSHCDRVARQVRLDTLESLQEKSQRVEFWR